MFTIPLMTAWLIAIACSAWDVTTGSTCQPHPAFRRSGSTSWGGGRGARVTHPAPKGFNASADPKPGAVDEDVVFSLAVQTNAHGSEITFVNLTAADLNLFLQCLINPSSQVCDFPSKYIINSLDVSQFNHTTYNFTCTLNTTTLRCGKSLMGSDIEPLGMFNVIDPTIGGMNATVYLSLGTTQTLMSVQWTDIRYIHFICLYRDSVSEAGDWILMYNIIGASLACVVLILLIITMGQSCIAIGRHRKEMDSSNLVQVELDKMKKSPIQLNLDTDQINTLPLNKNQDMKDNKLSTSSCQVSEINLAFELNESQVITRL